MSWNTTISTHEKPKLDELRKKANIAARKAALGTDPSRVNGASESSRPAVPIPRINVPPPQPTQDDKEHDLETITDFLAKGGAEDKEDDEVWEFLAQSVGRQSCLAVIKVD